MKLRRKLLIIPPVIAGVVLLVLFVRGREGPQRLDRNETVRPVRIVKAEARAIVPRVIGYGAVAPVKTWRAVAEVKGRVTGLHEDLQPGAILPADAELLRIDDTDYRYAIARLEAEVRSLEAQQVKLDATELNHKTSLEIERRSLELTQGELTRLERLLANGTVSATEVDVQRRQVLQQSASALSIENALRLIPSERLVLAAELAARQESLKVAARELNRCVVKTPFACRITEVDVELTQYVQPGQTMVKVDGILAMEVLVRFPFERVAPLLNRSGEIDFAAAIRDGALWERFGIGATVRLRSGPIQSEWDAHFARVSELVDQRTRTVGIIVEVEKPYEGVQPGVRPPLLRGMFVEVELRGKAVEGHVVIPREALHGNQVHVVTAEGRLAIRDVKPAFVQFDEACIAEGLAPGEQVVLTDLTPAVPGLLLGPVPAGEGAEE